MTTLALHGGEPEVKGRIVPYNSISVHEQVRAIRVMANWPLSGYLGGEPRGGRFVNELEDAWADRFKVRHAIAVNSATSGLLAAAFAVGLRKDDQFLVSPFTMSATAAAPMFTGAEPVFVDIAENTFVMSPKNLPDNRERWRAVVLTHLFGLGIDESWWKGWAHQNGMKLIVDAAQAPFAMEDGVHSGTMCDIGVFSLNVHKHIQCGEGGIVVTNNDDLAGIVRLFRNHGEMAGLDFCLNLRMTEVTAAIALAQLARADELIAGRIALAEALTAAVKELPGFTPPYVHPSCRHVYYCWALKVADRRDWFVKALQAEGVPIRAGYVDPLYRLKAFAPHASQCPVAERMHDRELALFEICAHDPIPGQIKQIGNAFAKVATHAHAHA